MKFVTEFRDPASVAGWVREIAHLAQRLDRPVALMEVCGGQTHTIFKHGLEALLPETVELIHGPGCPVCIMPRGRIDDAIALAEQPGMIFATFGDALRVPGARGSLMQAKARGADVRVVYSPLDALTLAQTHPDRPVVFFGLGFETTAPAVAMTILAAARAQQTNFSVFCNHVLVVPALEFLLQASGLRLDGFIGPGHVSAVIGTDPYQAVVDRYQKPVVVGGFEPIDLLQSIWMLLLQLVEGRCAVENQYHRLVKPEGNSPALAALAQVFTVREQFEWRGLGSLPRSGLAIAPAFAAFDAEQRYCLPSQASEDSPVCQCGLILQGKLKPWECSAFGRGCTPDHPLGACMVSSEGACAAYYKYGHGGPRSPMAAPRRFAETPARPSLRSELAR